MSTPQRFSLKWNNYVTHLTTAFDSLRDEDDFVDCTLSCDGKRIKAHKMLLSACSSYFKAIFKENPCQHPVIILKGVNYHDLESLVDFMYNGEVNVVQEQLGSFLNTAELLQVRGLTDGADRGKQTTTSNTVQPPPPPTESSLLPKGVTTKPDPPPIVQTHSSIPNTEPPPPKRKRAFSVITPPTQPIDISEHSMSSSSRSPAISSTVRVSESDNDVIEMPEVSPIDIPVKMEELEYEDENDNGEYINDDIDDNLSGQNDSKLSADFETVPRPSNSSILSDPGTSGEGASQDPSQVSRAVIVQSCA